MFDNVYITNHDLGFCQCSNFLTCLDVAEVYLSKGQSRRANKRNANRKEDLAYHSHHDRVPHFHQVLPRMVVLPILLMSLIVSYSLVFPHIYFCSFHRDLFDHLCEWLHIIYAISQCYQHVNNGIIPLRMKWYTWENLIDLIGMVYM